MNIALRFRSDAGEQPGHGQGNRQAIPHEPLIIRCEMVIGGSYCRQQQSDQK
jgi:hypothetical protein